MKIAVSELLVRFMERLGIKHIFGMPGAHILPIYDSLYHSGISSVLAKHEQGASFMASGYCRASGMKHYKVGREADLPGMLSALDYKKPINLIEIMIDKDIFPDYNSRR